MGVWVRVQVAVDVRVGIALGVEVGVGLGVFVGGGVSVVVGAKAVKVPSMALAIATCVAMGSAVGDDVGVGAATTTVTGRSISRTSTAGVGWVQATRLTVRAMAKIRRVMSSSHFISLMNMYDTQPRVPREV